MNLDQIETKCFILALFIRDDNERFLLGSRMFEFVDSQLHFAANTYQNDVVEVQGNDGIMLAGQVRRATSQAFDGYIGDSSVDRPTIEQNRQAFLKFFRKNHYYKVVYVFPDGSAIQRRNGFIVEAPEVKELYQLFPQYHISMNFEDINYYEYKEDEDGQEIYGESANLAVSTSATGGLIWDAGTEATLSGEGTSFTLNNTIYGNSIDNVQLKGDTTQSGTPTPSTPQPVNTVTGRQVVTISDGDSQTQSYEVNLGKNLFDKSTVSDGYRLNPSGGEYTDSNYTLSDYIQIKPSTTYSYSRSSAGGSNACIGYYDGSKTFISRGQPIISASSTSGTITTPSGAAYARISDLKTLKDSMQFELGSTATSYSDYFTPIELCKIGTYQDYIYQSGGDWYLYKAITKYIANGDANVTSVNTQLTNVARCTINHGLSTVSTGDLIICDKLITNASWGADQEQIYNASNSRVFAFINKSRGVTNVATCKTWLASNNLTCYIPLATATNTQITNAALVAQLNALAAATTYAEHTVFAVTSENQLGILSLSTQAWLGTGVVWDSIGATWEEGTGGGPTMISVDSIDNVYPILEITGPAVNPQISVLTTNTTLSYTGTVTASQVLKIDMFNKTATLNGTSVVGNVSGDWIYLAPGINRVTYTTTNADAPDSTLWWQEIVG